MKKTHAHREAERKNAQIAPLVGKNYDAVKKTIQRVKNAGRGGSDG
jgi:hypothetical protein